MANGNGRASHGWMNTLNAVTFKVVVLAVLQSIVVLGVFAVWAAAVLSDIHNGADAHGDLHESLIATLFYFLGALSGISGAVYGAKRFSDADYVTAKSAGKSQAIVNYTGDSPVTNVTATMPIPTPEPPPVADIPYEPMPPNRRVTIPATIKGSDIKRGAPMPFDDDDPGLA